METLVSTKNMVSIPMAIARHYGIEQGWKLDWKESDKPDQLIVTIIPDRAERARRLYGKGRCLAPDRDAVVELGSEREAEG